MEPKMNFYYPGEGSGEVVVPGGENIHPVEPTSPSGPSFPKPKTRKEYFLAYFLSKLNGLSDKAFNALPIPKMSFKDLTDDLRYAWLVRKFVSSAPFAFNEDFNAYTLQIAPFAIADEHGMNVKSITDFSKNNSHVVKGMYYEVIIDNTYSCNVFIGSLDENSVPCGPYTIIDIIPQEGEAVLYIISETEPTHIPVVDVYAHYIIDKQPKSTLEYYIAKAAGYPLLKTDNPPEPKTTEEIYWAAVCKESGGPSAGDDTPEIPHEKP